MKVNHNVALKPQSKIPVLMQEFNQTKELCLELLKTKHYQSMGEAGIFAIVQKANSLGINPLEALNGSMYFVQGKVELSSITMAKLIRAKGHSYTLGKESTPESCVLHGKRKDNGDTWKVSFSIDDAKRAGIYKQGGPWSKYPDIMCYNRALSKLARQLFPDVIGNCYVEGEISDAPPLYDTKENTVIEAKEEISHRKENTVSLSEADICIQTERAEPDRINYLQKLLDGFDEERLANFRNFFTGKFKVETLEELDSSACEWLINKIEETKERV